jgi:hypothetical protein
MKRSRTIYPLAGIFVGIALTLALTSCASVSVEDGAETVTQQKPKMIYILDFSTASGDWQVDREGRELVDFKRDIQYLLQKTMTEDLTKRLIYAEPGAKTDWSLHKNAWLIRGQFVTVYQGSRALRGVVGLGAGGTKLETHVQVYDLSHDSGVAFMTFSTSGGSNAEPGAAVTFTTAPLELALGSASGVGHGLSEDAKRTAREITAALSDYMYKRGWIPKDEWIEPKHSHGGDVY